MSDISAEKRDYYQVLGVGRDAEQKEIREAFRNLALRFHPDRNKEPGAEERFKEIAEAYAVLSDPKKREEYDHRGFAGVSGFSPEDLFGGIDFDDLFANMGFGFGFHRRRDQGADVEVGIAVSLQKIAQGGEESVRLLKREICPDCHGSRAEKGTTPRTCERCHGSGEERVSRRGEGNILIQQISDCPVCHGSGKLIDRYCKTCHGSGKIEKEETITVNIPRGIEEGASLRIPGKGEMPAGGRGIPGDLFVVVKSRNDSGFERSGADLWRRETISLVDAVLGCTLRIPTLESTAEVTVPPGTQPESVLRLKGKGLPQFSGSGSGDLYLRLKVHVPEHLSLEELGLYRRLAALKI